MLIIVLENWNYFCYFTFIKKYACIYDLVNTRVKDLMIAGSIIFNNFEEMSSNPLLFFIVFLTVSSLTVLSLRIYLTCVFK